MNFFLDYGSFFLENIEFFKELVFILLAGLFEIKSKVFLIFFCLEIFYQRASPFDFVSLCKRHDNSLKDFS